MELTSRDDARARGLKTFFTGVPCKWHHVSPRYVSCAACVECGPARTARGQAEMGTELYDEIDARYERERRAKTDANKGVSERQRAKGRARNQVCGARTPPWLTFNERLALRDFPRNSLPGFEQDHIVPLLPTGGDIFGLHTPENLRYLTRKKNRHKANRLEGDPADHVRLGRAVWKRDVAADGRVNWQPYVGDRLAPVLSRIAENFGTEPFIVADLKTIQVNADERWLGGNVGLLSGGFRLVVEAGLDGVIAWRLTTE